MSRRRILLTTDVVGGVWDFCLTLAEGLRAHDEVLLLAFGSPTLAQRQAATQAGAQLITLPLKLEWMNDADIDVQVTPALVQQVVRQVGADIVHANQFAAASADVGVPVVLTVHSDVLSWRRWTLGSEGVPTEWRTYASLVREAMHRADRVVAVSRFLADEATHLYAVNREIDVIHNGWPVRLSGVGESARERSTVVAGRIWDSAKNVALVAEAAESWDPGPVYLAGETQHPDGGQAAVPSPLQPLGFLARNQLDELLNRASVYISAARYDPFGLLPLQAALAGCALVLSDIPSYREVWGDAAYFFRSGDAIDLQRAWQRALAAPDDTRAYTLARERLSAERMMDQYQQVYAELQRAGRAIAA